MKNPRYTELLLPTDQLKAAYMARRRAMIQRKHRAPVSRICANCADRVNAIFTGLEAGLGLYHEEENDVNET